MEVVVNEYEEVVTSLIPEWLIKSSTFLIILIDEEGEPVFANDALKLLTKKEIHSSNDLFDQIIKYPNISISDFVDHLAHDAGFLNSGKKFVLGLSCGNEESEEIIWSDWEINKISFGSKSYFIGQGIKSRDVVLSDYVDMQKGISNAIFHEAGVFITDRDGNIITANNRFFELLPVSKREIVGTDFRNLICEKDTSNGRDILLFAQGVKNWSGDINMYGKNGIVKTLHTIVSPIRSPKGKTDRIIFIQFDITSAKKYEENKVRLEEIAFIQSHEFRRPIANMLGVMDLLNHEPHLKRLPQKVKLLLDFLKQSVQETDEIIAKIVSKTIVD